MSDAPILLYLEADDEITTVVRRVRAADPGRVVVVAPGRSRATSSVVALRLLGRAAEADGREVVVVGDALTRSLAAEAGLGAFASVEDARRAEPGAAPAAGVPTATIHVVRGPATDDTAPTLAAATAIPSGAGPDDVTRPVPVARHVRRPAMARPTARSVQILPVAAVAAVVLLLVGALVAGAVLLPAATITIVPRTDPVGPIDYVVAIQDPAVDAGTAEASATVTATGTYEVREPATGSVVLFNWTFFPVDVPAGTFVAAGEQAFATQADVTVPRGRLTPQGTIAAGDVPVDVVAAAPGPAANVAAEAINVVVNEGVDARLRGFPENPEPRVLNPEPTSGGVDESGPEITGADVEAAVTQLRDQLDVQVTQAGRPDDETITLAGDIGEPVIAGTDELAGTRDEPEVEVSATQAWEYLRVERAEVASRAAALLRADATAIPEGHELLEDSIEVSLLESRRAGGVVEVDVAVVADSTTAIDTAAVAERAAGLAPAEARTVLADLGVAEVELWPGWVATVPSMTWRIEVRVAGDAPAPSAVPSPTDRSGRIRVSGGRILGLDHGSRRIGVAIADLETGMAFARPAIQRRNLDRDLALVHELCVEEGVERVVIGLPLHGDGGEGEQALAARHFGDRLAESGLRVDYEDERLTTWEAGERLAEVGRRARRGSGELDSTAARLILQQYLDARRRRTPSEETETE